MPSRWWRRIGLQQCPACLRQMTFIALCRDQERRWVTYVRLTMVTMVATTQTGPRQAATAGITHT